MSLSEVLHVQRVPLSRSQQNIYNGVLRDADPQLYLIGRRYRFQPIRQTEFLTALRETIRVSPVHVCVLELAPDGDGYPELVPRLNVDDIVRVCGDDESAALADEWGAGIVEKPLARYTVRVDGNGWVRGLDAQAHHILLDGGAIGIIEAHLGRFLAGDGSAETTCIRDGLTAVATAHHREAIRIDESRERLSTIVRQELTATALTGGCGMAADVAATASKGVLIESTVLRGADYDAILDLADRENVALNVLVAAAATAVEASIRHTTECLLVHAVDNRFGDPELAVATCLVNSMAQPVEFSPYASAAEVVGAVDRGYVKAGRRRWLREEHYRRMYLAINRTTSVRTLTLNFLREPCAPELTPFLAGAPVTSDIGPVEGMTVAAVLDEQRQVLTLNVWDRLDRPQQHVTDLAGRVGAALRAMTTLWDSPIAMAVDDWRALADDGMLGTVAREYDPAVGVAPAWFLHRPAAVAECRRHRPHVDSWIAWLLETNVAPGDVVVFTDDNTDKTIGLLIACHLAGCGYSVCDRDDEVPSRALRINQYGNGISAHIVDVASANIASSVGPEHRCLVAARVEQTATDPRLATRTAYVMPTSGSTGEPKLVNVSHGSLATFCAGMSQAYGWGPDDTILQCAPLTSDISVEEVFGAALSGAMLVRSGAVKAGDLQAFTAEVMDYGATIVDMPTALWHLWCDDVDAIAGVARSQLRQIVIGGEPVRPAAIDKWVNVAGIEGISLVSSYGPTETTVVVTYLPIIDRGQVLGHAARRRVGPPVVPSTVVIAFGEVVVMGEMVADGYLGADDAGFGLVTMPDGRRKRAFATGDRITVDGEGYPMFAGRKDALIKISGKRVDTAEITRRIVADPAIGDVAVELHNGRLGVWFATERTRDGGEDLPATVRIRNILVDSRVPSFIVSGVASIPRKTNGKTDTARLPTSTASGRCEQSDTESDARATGLAEIWSAQLGRPITPDTSLVCEGVGSLDLVRILPDTRQYLGRQLSMLDLVSADTAANLVADVSMRAGWMDRTTAAQIDRDFGAVATQRVDAVQNPPRSRARGGGGPILVVGASGILGTGFAEAILDLTRSGVARPELVLAARSVPTSDPIWAQLQAVPGVRIEHLVPGFGPPELAALIRQTGARTLVNCIGNTNVVAPYRELRSANVELVAAMAQTCAASGTRLVHLSTYVVNGNVAMPEVVDPRQAPYPYAASKALAELTVSRADRELDFTIVRLPRVLGTSEQMRGSADILVSVVEACRALQAYPAIELTEEVTTGRAAAAGILRRIPEFGGPDRLGRGIDVVRGQAVRYQELLGTVARDRVDSDEWKRRLDDSQWAKSNPRRWSVIDAWIGLGLTLGGRSYADYLADYPAIPLDIRSVGELVAEPPPVQVLLAPDARELIAGARRPINQTPRHSEEWQ